MSDGTIGNVKRMSRELGAPTAPLAEFLEAYRDDDNWWWRISCGHHMNLFEMATDEVLELQERVKAFTDDLQTLYYEQVEDGGYAAVNAVIELLAKHALTCGNGRIDT